MFSDDAESVGQGRLVDGQIAVRSLMYFVKRLF